MSERHVLVTVWWIVSGVSLAAALAIMSLGGPEWVLAALLGVCFATMVPIVFSDVRRDWQTLSGYRAVLGPIRFGALLVGTVLIIFLFAGIHTWLASEIGWPEHYGFDCRGRGCWIDDLSHSPRLLRGGSAYEVALLALLWLFPAIIVGCAIYALSKRRRRDRIQPLD